MDVTDLRASFPDRNTICYERTYQQAVDRVWQAITDEEQSPKWFVPFPTHFELRSGGRWWMDEPGDPVSPTFRGTIGDLQHGSRVEFLWDNTNVTWFEVEPEGDATRLRFCHRQAADAVHDVAETPDGSGWDEQPMGPGTFQPGLAAAWHEHLDRLRFHLDGDAVPPAGTVSREVIDAYRELIISSL